MHVYTGALKNLKSASGLDYLGTISDLGKPWSKNSLGTTYLERQFRPAQSSPELAHFLIYK